MEETKLFGISASIGSRTNDTDGAELIVAEYTLHGIPHVFACLIRYSGLLAALDDSLPFDIGAPNTPV